MKTKLSAICFGIAIASYIIFDYQQSKYDRLYRLAAGESFYEKTHFKKNRK